MNYAVRIALDGEPSDEIISIVQDILEPYDWESDYDGGININGNRVDAGEWIVSIDDKISIFSDHDFNRLVRKYIDKGNIYE